MVSPRNIRLALAILVVAAITGLTAAIFLKGSPSAPPAEPMPRQLSQNIDIALNNARFTEMRDGAVVWELVAERAEYDRTGEQAHLSGIRLTFAKPPAADKIVVTADRGEYSDKSKNIRLTGRVHMETGEGAVFDTASIDYLAKDSLFRTHDPVTFRHQRLDLTARGMELKVKDQTARFGRPVDAIVGGVEFR
jgi:LPS export ABC transporter protein LptC